MEDLVLHLWLLFHRNRKQIYDCPGLALSQVSLGHMYGCQVNCHYLIPCPMSLCKAIYAQTYYCSVSCLLVQEHICQEGETCILKIVVTRMPIYGLFFFHILICFNDLTPLAHSERVYICLLCRALPFV